MFRMVLLSLFGYVFAEMAKEYLLCRSSNVEIRYTLWDEKNIPSVYLETCDYKSESKVNLSLTWIPRMDLHHLTVMAEAWIQSMKISEYSYDLCSGVDDAFEYCGSLRGDEKNHPNVSFQPCIYHKNIPNNLFLTWIPRMDLHQFKALLKVWDGSETVYDNSYDICTGVHDEFEWCGALKGETVQMFFETYFTGQFIKGTFTIHIEAFAGEPTKLAFGSNVTLVIKE
ncbi:lymphocyte antigen 96-like [Discoglossus pictus]